MLLFVNQYMEYFAKPYVIYVGAFALIIGVIVIYKLIRDFVKG